MLASPSWNFVFLRPTIGWSWQKSEIKFVPHTAFAQAAGVRDSIVSILLITRVWLSWDLAEIPLVFSSLVSANLSEQIHAEPWAKQWFQLKILMPPKIKVIKAPSFWHFFFATTLRMWVHLTIWIAVASLFLSCFRNLLYGKSLLFKVNYCLSSSTILFLIMETQKMFIATSRNNSLLFVDKA